MISQKCMLVVHIHICQMPEGLAVTFGLNKCHKYLFGDKFQSYSDHKPHLGLLREKCAPCRE